MGVGNVSPSSAALSPPLLEVCGHSYAQGKGAYNDLAGYGPRVASSISAQRQIYRGYSGSVACHPSIGGVGDGGYSWMLNTLGPSVSPLSLESPAYGTTGSSGKYGSRHNVIIHEHALNDLGSLGPNNLTPMLRAHEVIWSRMCASRMYVTNGAAFTKAGTWATTSTTTQGNANQYFSSSTINSTITQTLESDMPSGLVYALGFIVLSNDNVVVTVTQNGNLIKTEAIQGSVLVDPASTANGYVLRMGVPGDGITFNASDVIVLTVATVTAGNVRFNYSQVEANPLDGPVIITPLPSHLPAAGYAFYAANFAQGALMNDAAIETCKVGLLGIMPAFGARMLSVDFDQIGIISNAVFPNGSYISDGVHPNDYSHGQRAQFIVSTLRQSGMLTARLMAGFEAQPFPFWYSLSGASAWGASSLLGVALSNSWTIYDPRNSTFVATYPGYYRDEVGVVHFRGRVKGGASGSIMATIPPGYNSSSHRMFQLVAGLDDQWTVTVTAVSGTFTLTIAINGITNVTTAAIQFNANAATVVAAIQAALSTGPYGTADTDVAASGSLSTGMLLTFITTLGGKPQGLTADSSGLTGGAATPLHTTTGAQFGATAEISNNAGGGGSGFITLNCSQTFSWIDLTGILFTADC